MFRDMSTQMFAALAEQTRLKEGEGLLLAVHPDFILVVRAGMDRDERNTVADALLTAAGGLSLPVMEDEESETGDSLRIPPDLLELAGFPDLEDLTYTVENGRIIIEGSDC